MPRGPRSRARQNNNPMKTQTMKKTIALCATLLVGSASLLAENTASAVKESPYAVTVDFPYVSKYVFRGIQVARDSIQPSVEIAAGDVYAGVWNNTPLRNEHDDNISKELDFYLGYTPKLTENLKADIGLTYYWYPSVSKSYSDHSFEVFAGVNWTLGNFTPSLYVYRDLNLDTTTGQAALGYSIPLKSWGTSLDLNATVGIVSPDHGSAYDYYSVGATVPVKLSDAVKLSFGLNYTVNDIAGAKDPGLWGTAGVTVSF